MEDKYKFFRCVIHLISLILLAQRFVYATGAADGDITFFELISFSSGQHIRLPAPVPSKYISGSIPYALTPPIPHF